MRSYDNEAAQRQSYDRHASSHNSSSPDADCRRRIFEDSSGEEAANGTRGSSHRDQSHSPQSSSMQRQPWKETDEPFGGMHNERRQAQRQQRSGRYPRDRSARNNRSGAKSVRSAPHLVRTDKGGITGNRNAQIGLKHHTVPGLGAGNASAPFKNSAAQDMQYSKPIWIYPLQIMHLRGVLSNPAILHNLLRQFNWYNITRINLRMEEAIVEFCEEALRDMFVHKVTSVEPRTMIRLLPPVPVYQLYTPQGQRLPPIPIVLPHCPPMGPPPGFFDNGEDLAIEEAAPAQADAASGNSVTLSPSHGTVPKIIKNKYKYISTDHEQQMKVQAARNQKERHVFQKRNDLLKKYTATLQKVIAQLAEPSIAEEEKAEKRKLAEQIRNRISSLTQLCNKEKNSAEETKLLSQLQQLQQSAAQNNVCISEELLRTQEKHNKYKLDLRSTTLILPMLPPNITTHEPLVEWTVERADILLLEGIESLRLPAPCVAELTYVTRTLAEKVFKLCQLNGITVEWRDETETQPSNQNCSLD